MSLVEASNPRIPRKKGQPAKSKKHSDLYTDEDPKGTIHGLGFKDVATAKKSVSKIRGSSRSHAHKIQAAIAMEQRARVMGKTAEAAIYRSFINSMKKKTKKMNEEKVEEGWSDKYKKSIDCDNPKGFSQKAHCQGKKKKMNEDKQIKKIVKQLRKSVKSHAKQADTLEKKITEGSLHKWFKGSKSKDGKGGWVNVVTGGTCASDEPGEGTPKCVSSAKRASMSKKERLSAARRKKRADPNQQAKSGAAKPTYVATDKPKKKMKEELEYIDLPLEVEIPSNLKDFNRGLMFRESLENDKGMLFIFERVGQYSFYMKNTTIPLDVAFVTEDGIVESIKSLEPNDETAVSSDGQVLFAIEANRGWFAENNVEVGDEIVLGEAKDKKGKGSGTKDACYHKVKSRYSVWPSAYASGALVKCRKVGAANWGNKSEGYIPEEGYDHLRDRGMVRPSKDKKDATTMPPSKEMMKTRKVNKGPSALDIVKKKYGKSVMKMEARDEYGDPVGGPKISKKQKAKNLSSNTPDEQHTTTTSEAKVDKPMIFGKSLARNERKFGKKGSTQPQGYFGQKPSQAAELSKKRTDEHKAKRGVKTKGVMEDVVTEKCWPGYEKKGMKTMFGKRYPNCVKKKVKREEYSDWRDELQIDEGYGTAVVQGTKQLGKLAVRQGIKVGGKQGGYAVKKAGKVAGEAAKEVAIDAGKGALKGAKERAAKAGENFTANIGKSKQVNNEGNIVEGPALLPAVTYKKSEKPGKFEKAGRVAGGLTGGIGGGLAGAAVGGGVASLATGVAGGVAGDVVGTRVGGSLGKTIDKVTGGKKKPMVAKEEKLTEAPAKVPLKDTGNPIQNIWNKFVPPPESSNNPKVRSGELKPGKLEAPLLNKMNKTAETINKPIKATSSTIKKGKEIIDTIKTNPVKAGAKVAKVAAAPVAAGLAVSKGVDALMKRGKKTQKESFSNWRDELGFEGKDSSKKIDEDWQKVNRKDKTDGLSQKAVDAYRRENPGSKLKTAVTKDPKKLKKGSKSAKRRLSFCRRMKGMKKKLTSAKTSRDPDSRINKALRRWNCSYEPTGTTIAEKALSKKQQKFFGIVRAAQKGTLDGEASPQVQRAAADMKMKDVKKFASTKHKGLPEKVKSEE